MSTWDCTIYLGDVRYDFSFKDGHETPKVGKSIQPQLMKNKNYPSVTARCEKETGGGVMVFFLLLFEKLFYGTAFKEVIVE